MEVKDEDGGEGTKKNKVIVSKEIIEASLFTGREKQVVRKSAGDDMGKYNTVG